MARIEFELQDGLPLGDEWLRHVVLREVTAGDIIDAREESERPVMIPQPDGSVAASLVSSPALFALHLLRRQVVKVGNLSGPLEMSHLRRLSERDLDRLNAKAAELDDAVANLASPAATAEAVASRGRAGADQSRD